MYENIRERLNTFYFEELPGEAERVKNTVFEKMDEYDRNNPDMDQYKLKEELYRTIVDTIKPRIFEDIPFYYETGALVAWCDGLYNRGAIHANGWLFMRNEHLMTDDDPHAYEVFLKNKQSSLYTQTSRFVDMMHIGLPMRKAFTVGLKGVYEELTAAEPKCETEEERNFISCAKVGIEALHSIQLKLADAAAEAGNAELAEMAKRVPWEAPKTFHEGLCTLAFMRKALGTIEGVGFNSFGRVDVLLKPLYESDKAKGVSDERLIDLICRFLIVWDCTMDRRAPLEGTCYFELENTLTLGGCDENGNAVFNDVTKLFLEARKQTEALYPKFMLRYSASSPKEYLELISAPMLESKNFSLYENDDSIIPALIESGITPYDAANYVVGGCWDPLVPECFNKFSGEYVSVLRPLEMSIHNDKEGMDHNEIWFESLEDCKNFDELYERYLGFVHKLLLRKAEPMAKASRLWYKANPACTLSALMETCIDKRRDMTAGGTKYNRESLYFSGFSDAADSLLVIKKLCFDEKVCTLSELFAACRDNWQNEELRHRAINVCSFGDGSEESSRFAAKLHDDLYALTRGLPTAYGGEFRVGYNQYTEIIFWGRKIAATPNGRRNGEYICQGITPSRLQKPMALTDIFGSFKYMDMKKSAGNASITVTLPGGKMSLDQLVGFLRATAVSGIQALQPSCLKREELLAAQKDPDSYRHIIVRVCGFSAPFVLLSPTYQEEILSRTVAGV